MYIIQKIISHTPTKSIGVVLFCPSRNLRNMWGLARVSTPTIQLCRISKHPKTAFTRCVWALDNLCSWLNASWQDIATRAQSRKAFQLQGGAVLSMSFLFSMQAVFLQSRIFASMHSWANWLRNPTSSAKSTFGPWSHMSLRTFEFGQSVPCIVPDSKGGRVSSFSIFTRSRY